MHDRLSKESLILIADAIIDREGGYVDHPNDRGGPTNFGITMKALVDWRGRSVTPEEIKLLSREEARQIMIMRYITKPGIYVLGHMPIVNKMADMSVHHGWTRAIKILQQVVEVTKDGIMGPVTRNAALNHQVNHLLTKLVKARSKRFCRIVKNDTSQAVFLEGWIARSESFLPYQDLT